MGEAFIKLHRKMLKWEWYDNINTCRLFLHCLLKANWQPTKWQGIELQPGQFITSLTKLSDETSLTIRQVRDSLNRLISTGELTSKTTNKYRVITINNWEDYQGYDKQTDKQMTSKTSVKGQTNDKQMTGKPTTDKEYKEKEEEKEYKDKKHIYGEYNHVRLTDKERDKLFNDYGEDESLKAIKYLDEYIEMKGYKAKNHNLALRKWVFDAVREERRKRGETGFQRPTRTDDEQREREEHDRYIESDEYKQLVGTEADMPFV